MSHSAHVYINEETRHPVQRCILWMCYQQVFFTTTMMMTQIIPVRGISSLLGSVSSPEVPFQEKHEGSQAHLAYTWLTVIGRREKRISFSLEKWPYSVFKWAKGQSQSWWLQRGNDCEGKMRLCVLSALSVCFHGHWGSSQLSGLLRAAASITIISNVGEAESEKSTRSFPLITCVYTV